MIITMPSISRTDAARWYALAEVAIQVANGASRDLAELRRLAQACAQAATFGANDALDPCNRLLVVATDTPRLARPDTNFDRLKACAEAVKAAYYDWEAVNG